MPAPAPSQNVSEVVALLRRMLEEHRTDDALTLIASVLGQMAEKNTELELRLGKLLKQQYGRKSEKLDREQLSLFVAQLGDALAGGDAAGNAMPAHAPATGAEDGTLAVPKMQPRKGHGRKPLPPGLLRETVILNVANDKRVCKECGAEKTRIGFEKSEVIEFIPASFKVLVNCREKVACRRCAEGVVIAPVADKVIDSGLPGPGLIADILVSKYRDSLPLNRLSKRYAGNGVDFAVSTLADWVGGGADALAPVAERILEMALKAYLLQTDDTGLRVLDRDHPAGIKKGHIWVYLGDEKWAAFRYTPNWKSDDARTVLGNRRGWLMHDGYGGYDVLHAGPNPIAIEVACWSHFRRGFVDCLDAGNMRAAMPLQLIGEMFHIERAATTAELSAEERLARREQLARPLVEKLGRWMADAYNLEPPKSALSKAIAYGINRWTALLRFLEDGKLPLENNASERSLRGIAIGRKNYLFAGSDTGANRAAIVYTIIGTCALNRVDAWAYLKDILSKLAAGWPNARLDELLPPNWAAAQRQAEQAKSAGAAA